MSHRVDHQQAEPPPVIVLGGTTASGKSALAIALAQALDGVVVNADSQQLFADLPLLTAQPGAAELALAPHRLYGILRATEAPSAGRWLDEVRPVLAEIANSGRTAIVTGGSGLYLHALLHGLPEMPAIDPALRHELRAWASDRPGTAIHLRLAAHDPEMAARLRPSDRQRCLRALEVVLGTGRSLRQLQTRPTTPPLAGPIRGWALLPPPEATAPRIEARLHAMLDQGALAEVAELLQRQPDASACPLAKLHGMRELAAVVAGQRRVEEVIPSILTQIRRYAKRQRTWFRHQLPELAPILGVGEDPSLRDRVLAASRAGTPKEAAA